MIWGVDIGLNSTGITAGDGSKKPAVGAWGFDYCADDLGQLLNDFDTELCRTADLYPPTHVIYEAPLLLPSDKLLTLRKTYAMGAYLELFCRQRAAVCEEASNRKLKKILTGNHLAKKPEMVAMVRRLGIPLPLGKAAEDAADSFAAWYLGVSLYARAHCTAWDQALYSRKGFLV